MQKHIYANRKKGTLIYINTCIQIYACIDQYRYRYKYIYKNEFT
jgi:hypothetical protein